MEEGIERWMTVPGIVSACVQVKDGEDGDGVSVDGDEEVSIGDEGDEDEDEGEDGGSVGLDGEGRSKEEEGKEEGEEETYGVQNADAVAAAAAGSVGEGKQDEAELKVVWIGREMSTCSEWFRLFSLDAFPCALSSIQF